MSTEALRTDFHNLRVGDIFLATYPGAASGRGTAICLVLHEDADQIHARSVTTQWIICFCKSSLKSTPDSLAPFVVQYAKPLPPDVSTALLHLDRRYSNGGEAKMTIAEKRALIFVDGLLPDQGC